MYKLSPSKAHRYLQCTKSLEYDTEFVETPWTIRGNILHEFGEKSYLKKKLTYLRLKIILAITKNSLSMVMFKRL